MKRLFLGAFALLSACATTTPPAGWLTLSVPDNLPRLLAEADTDHDLKITVRDHAKRFDLRARDGETFPVKGTYSLSVLLQELKLAEGKGEATLRLDPATLREPPAARTSRLIREIFWDGLTRRLDAAGVALSVADPKTASADGSHYLYVPHGDAYALRYYQGIARARKDLKLKVVQLPKVVTPKYFASLAPRHGLLTLKVEKDARTGEPRPLPYVVPGGRFNEMYGWDSYFIVRGLLVDGKIDLARDMVENHAYQIEHYGKILNANRTYFLTRTQPPFFTSMVRAVYEAGPKDEAAKAWLARHLAHAIDEYRHVWTVPPRFVKEYGLSRYFDEGEGPGPEAEPGSYDALLAPFAKKLGIGPRELLSRYIAGKVHDPALKLVFKHDRTVRETGHDTTYRFSQRAADFLTVDLNSLLYKYETDLADLLSSEFGGEAKLGGYLERAADWRRLADARRQKIQALLWDEDDGFFYDFDLQKKERSGYVSATAFYPFWAGLATPEQAKRVYALAKEDLVESGGLAATSLDSRGALHPPERPQRQWDYPNGWPPHQMLAWEGLARYGMNDEAERMAFDWVYTIAKNARDYNGMVTEKYDVEKSSHEAFAEYGNVGTDFSYITREGFGWTNASYQLGLRRLSPAMRARLDTDVNPN